MNFIIDYNKAAYADTILWIDDENKIEDLEPFIDFIRCDYDNEEYQAMSQTIYVLGRKL